MYFQREIDSYLKKWVAGLELLKYAEPYARHDLYYWCNLNRSANAEVDYVIERDMKVTPLEVKAGLREEVLGLTLAAELW